MSFTSWKAAVSRQVQGKTGQPLSNLNIDASDLEEYYEMGLSHDQGAAIAIVLDSGGDDVDGIVDDEEFDLDTWTLDGAIAGQDGSDDDDSGEDVEFDLDEL